MINNKLILVDIDGVLLNWSYAFEIWMNNQGYTIKEKNYKFMYNLDEVYGLKYPDIMKLMKYFNESASIGFLPPMRDAIHYIKKLHEEHGYIFQCISSFSSDYHAAKLRKKNLRKLFGETVFDKFSFLNLEESKKNILSKYKGSGLYYIEDLPEHAIIGKSLGLKSLLLEHAYNMDCVVIPRFKNWNEIYEIIIGDK